MCGVRISVGELLFTVFSLFLLMGLSWECRKSDDGVKGEAESKHGGGEIGGGVVGLREWSARENEGETWLR